MNNSDKEITFDVRRDSNVPPVELNLHHPKVANDATLFSIIGYFIVIYGGKYFWSY